MLIREYNDVILGLTSPDWPWSHMNELLVPAQKGLKQWNLPAPELPNVHGAQPLNSTLEFWYMKGYFEVQNMVKCLQVSCYYIKLNCVKKYYILECFLLLSNFCLHPWCSASMVTCPPSYYY